ncbi:MAG: DnaJ domain-containing protein [Rhodocyclaceae bacterium]|nr:DnaJ domain-containing protein [Rhodocyclaceae bacterium]
MSDPVFDPHAILEIEAGADAATIRRAFRRLAMRWHPDRNADPGATETFKRIRAAFEWLTSDAPADDVEASPSDPAGPSGMDRHETLEVTLAELIMGCDKPFVVRRLSECEACEGAGSVRMRHTRMCDICHGSGKVRTPAGLERCHLCAGRGFVQHASCEHCGGSGEALSERTVTVHVEAGLLPGEVLRLKGLGEPGGEGGLPGTLFLTLALADDPLFSLEGRDIHVRQPISALRLLAGGRVSLAGPLGPVVMDLPPGDGLGPGTLRLSGQGFPGRGGTIDGAGDLVVHLEPLLPSALSASDREALQGLEARLDGARDRHYPGLDSWWRTYLASRP